MFWKRRNGAELTFTMGFFLIFRTQKLKLTNSQLQLCSSAKKKEKIFNDFSSIRSIHRVNANANRDIDADQLVHVTGYLNTNEFTNVDGKRRYEARINAINLSTLETSNKDVNSVEIRGVVASDVISTSDFAMFRVLTTFVSK